VIATMARIPPKSVSSDDKKVLEHLERDLEARRLRSGQGHRGSVPRDEAEPRRSARSGQADRLFLFSGPTGVGKTESRAVWPRSWASRCNASTCRNIWSAFGQRLIGAPPGYVGFDQGGLLTDAIDQQPHCVLLLDEIEKAHPDLFNILLQVMDNGR
jgi:ATP-dependent Clp protease ATP-binding subunit ClpA